MLSWIHGLVASAGACDPTATDACFHQGGCFADARPALMQRALICWNCLKPNRRKDAGGASGNLSLHVESFSLVLDAAIPSTSSQDLPELRQSSQSLWPCKVQAWATGSGEQTAALAVLRTLRPGRAPPAEPLTMPRVWRRICHERERYM